MSYGYLKEKYILLLLGTVVYICWLYTILLCFSDFLYYVRRLWVLFTLFIFAGNSCLLYLLGPRLLYTFVGYCFKQLNSLLSYSGAVKATSAPCIFCPCREKDFPKEDHPDASRWGKGLSGWQDDKALWFEILAVNSCPFAVHLVSATWPSDDTKWRRGVSSA